MDEFTIGIIGATTGIFGLGIAVISYFKQTQLEKRFKEKERIILLANEINDLINFIKWNYLDLFIRPAVDDDKYFDLDSLGKAVVSNAFDEKVTSVSIEIEVDLSSGHDEAGKNESRSFPIWTKEDVTKHVEEHDINYISIYCKPKYSGNMTYLLLFLGTHFDKLDVLVGEYSDLLEKFSPGLLADLYNCMEEVILKLVISSIDTDEIKVDTKDFDKTIDIGFFIYDRILGVNQLASNRDELNELITKAEKLRETLLTTGYA